MCQFLSAIVTRTGEIYWSPWTDSHSDLIAIHKLKEGKSGQNFARVEFTPDADKGHACVAGYTLKVDETMTPSWLDEDRLDGLRNHLSHVVKAMIVTDGREILIGGSYILAGDAKVESAQHCRIVSMSGSAKVGSMYDSANVVSMSGSAKVGSMYDSAKVGSMSGSANVVSMSDSANVVNMYDSANVGSMSGSANVGRMSDSANVGSMYGSAKVPDGKRPK